jgi:hypothetical protein
MNYSFSWLRAERTSGHSRSTSGNPTRRLAENRPQPSRAEIAVFAINQIKSILTCAPNLWPEAPGSFPKKKLGIGKPLDIVLWFRYHPKVIHEVTRRSRRSALHLDLNVEWKVVSVFVQAGA